MPNPYKNSSSCTYFFSTPSSPSQPPSFLQTNPSVSSSSFSSPMGCGNSKVNASGDSVPARIRPLLLRRYEELRKRRHGGTLQGEGTLSKKKLLKDNVDDDGNSQSFSEIETVYKMVASSPKENEPAKEETAVRVPIDNLCKVVPLVDSEDETDKEEDRKDNTEQNDKDKDHNQEKVKDVEDKTQTVVETEEGKAAEKEHIIDEKNDDDDYETVDFGRFVCPGSPSFRIYCIEPQNQKEESKSQETAMQPKSPNADDVKSPASVHQKSLSADSIESASSANSGNSNEAVEIESSTKTKEKSKKKFRAVKNLLSVTSYYSSCTCTGNDRSRPLAAKAAN